METINKETEKVESKKEEMRRKLSETKKRLYSDGKLIPYWKNRKRDEKTKEKIRKVFLGKSYEELYGKEKSDNMRKKQSEKHQLRKEMLGYINSPETRKRISEIKKGKPIHTIESKMKISKFFSGKKISEKHKERISLASQERWKNPDMRNKIILAQIEERLNRKGIRPTKPEKLLIEIINKNNLLFTYVGNGKWWLRGITRNFNPDFINKERKLIIELFGSYWHNREDMKKRDKERLETYSKYGYKTLIIWEHELVKDIRWGEIIPLDEIKNKIDVFQNG